MSLVSKIVEAIQAIGADIKTWLRIKNIRVVVASSASGAINTTADYDFIVLAIPANTLQVGDVINFDIYDLIKKGTGNFNILHYLKVNTTKSANASIALPNAATDSIGFVFRGSLQVRSIVAGVATFSYSHNCIGNSNLTVVGSNVVPTLTASVNSAINITVGANFSVANAANSVRPVAGGIRLLW